MNLPQKQGNTDVKHKKTPFKTKTVVIKGVQYFINNFYLLSTPHIGPLPLLVVALVLQSVPEFPFELIVHSKKTFTPVGPKYFSEIILVLFLDIQVGLLFRQFGQIFIHPL